MPSKSKAQQRLMGQAWAIRKGELERNSSNKSAQEIADSDITDKELKAFAETSHKSLPERIKEALEMGRLETLRENENAEYDIILEDKKKTSKVTKINPEGTSNYGSKFNTFTNYKYANKKKPKYQLDKIQSKTIILLPNVTYNVEVFIKVFEEKNFKFLKVKTKMLLSSEASIVLKSKKDKKWYKETRDRLSSGPSVALSFEYDGEDLDKDFKSAREKLRRILKLKALHEAFVYDINDSPYFAGIDAL